MQIKTDLNLKKQIGHVKRNNLKVKNLEDFGKIRIIRIFGKNDADYTVWKTMLEKHHYLQSGKLYGQQIKYLIRSEKCGWIGALGFASPSWRLEARDERIGWDDETRRKELKKIVCNNRFLILPEFGIKNIASHVMSLCLKRLPEDWEMTYQIKPILVETFVDSEKFLGTCYKASNWILAGETKGRGRDDRYHRNSFSKKYIYLYELKKGVLKPALKEEGQEDWVSEEFRYAEMPNKAKKKRLISITKDFFAKPASPITMCCEGQAKQKGAYRFFSDEEVKPEDILNSHIKQTIERAREHKVVLSVNDTTSFNLSNHKGTKGLGCLSNVQKEFGYLLHDTVLFTPEGVPLGILDAQTWTRKIKEYGKRHARKKKGIEEKESSKWLKSLRAVSKVQQVVTEVKFVSVGDREADIYELFELAEETGSSFLVRSSQNRTTSEGDKIWDIIDKQKPSGKMKVNAYGRDKKEREAEIEIRFLKAEIPAPKSIKNEGEVTIWAISAKETNVPKSEEALHWKLFTNMEVKNFEQACEKVEWYTIRFKIETYHRILKSGRRSENKRLNTVERLERCLAIDMITAWRIMYLTMLGRKTPEIQSNFFFNQNEIEVLKRIKYGSSYNEKKSLCLKEAISVIAILGGFVLGRKRAPGVEVMWRGLRRLGDISLGASLMKDYLSDKTLKSYNLDYG